QARAAAAVLTRFPPARDPVAWTNGIGGTRLRGRPASDSEGQGMMVIKRAIEAAIFNSRWLLVAFYLGLAARLLVLMFEFGRNVVEFVIEARSQSDADVITGVLGLVDLTLTGNLIVIVIFSGYENFISKIDTRENQNWPDWFAKIDFSGLKHKLLASIVAIASVHVLEVFMYLENSSDTTNLTWMVGIFVVFVLALLVVAVADRIGEGGRERH